MNLAFCIGWVAILALGEWFYLERYPACNEKKKTRKVIYICVAAAAGVLLAVFHSGGRLTENMKLLTLVMLLFPIAWTDYYDMKIPNLLIAAGLGLWAPFTIIKIFTAPADFLVLVKSTLFACAIVAVFFIMGVFVIKNGIGMGDIKLLLLLALYQGLYGMFSTVFFSLLISLIAAVVLLAAGKKKRKDTIPFAPAVLAGTYLSVLLTTV